MWKTYRTIVLEPNAQATVDSCAQKVSRFDDIWGGLEWLLARKPECGVIKIVSGVRYNLCVRKSDDLAKTDGIERRGAGTSQQRLRCSGGAERGQPDCARSGEKAAEGGLTKRAFVATLLLHFLEPAHADRRTANPQRL